MFSNGNPVANERMAGRNLSYLKLINPAFLLFRDLKSGDIANEFNIALGGFQTMERTNFMVS